jgi:asparagine synthase (glutamine-hydrolysing)
MCGFAGFLTSLPMTQSEGERILSNMGQVIKRRGPDGGGTWWRDGLGLVHRRLAIVDLTDAGKQPMTSTDGQVTLAFNGEIYNHKALRKVVEEKSGFHAWRGSSDTETLMMALHLLGVRATLDACIGMFAFAFIDGPGRKLILGRDRFGEKPLYVARTASGAALAFGSDLEALLCFPGIDQAIDPLSAQLYFSLGFIPGQTAMLRGVSKVPPGEVWHIDLSRPDAPFAQEVYWSAAHAATQAKASPYQGTADEAQARFESLLRDAVRMQMDADVEVGSFLSGGLDSTLLTGIMQEASPQRIKTFTIGFEAEGYNEAPQAKAIAHHLGTQHTEHMVSNQDIQDLISQVPACYDEPMADASQVPMVILSKVARQSVKVCISGDGGDEALGGYNRHMQAGRLLRLMNRIPPAGRDAAAHVLGWVPSSSIDAMERAAHRAGIKVVSHWSEKLHKLQAAVRADSLPEIYAHLLAKSTASLQHQDATGSRGSAHAGQSALASLLPTFSDALAPAEQFMAWDAATYLPADVLTKVDRATMAFGLESRAPFLDHRIYEFMFSTPERFKLNNGLGKLPSRKLIAQYIPRGLTQAPKRGFAAPVGGWIKGPARAWAESLLSAQALQRSGQLNVAHIRGMWQQHLSGQQDWQHPLWTVLMFQAWYLKLQRSQAA